MIKREPNLKFLEAKLRAYLNVFNIDANNREKIIKKILLFSKDDRDKALNTIVKKMNELLIIKKNYFQKLSLYKQKRMKIKEKTDKIKELKIANELLNLL